MRPLKQLHLQCIGAITLASCQPSRHDANSAVETDSTSGATVHITALAQIRAPLIPSELVYSTDRIDSLQFGDNAAAGFAPDSSLFVASGSDLFLVSPDGTKFKRLARAGDGPGEFRQISHLGIASDGSAIVGDQLSGRITMMDESSAVRRIYSRLVPTSDGREVDPVAVLDNGSLLTTSWQRRPNRGALAGIAAGDVERDPVPLVLRTPDGVPNRVLGTWAGLERAKVNLEQQVARLPIAFARSALYDARGNVTAIGTTDSIDITLFNGANRTAHIVGPAEGRAPTREQMNSWRDAIRALNSDVAQVFLRALDGAPAVPRLPTVGGIVVDSRSRIWIGAFVTPSTAERTWYILDAGGVPVGITTLSAYTEAMLPGKTELLDVYGDRLALLRRHDSGELTIEVREIGTP